MIFSVSSYVILIPLYQSHRGDDTASLACGPYHGHRVCSCLRTNVRITCVDSTKRDDAQIANIERLIGQTENAINTRPGNGVWKTVTGLGKVQRRYLDPVAGQAGYYGTVEEGSDTAVVTVRVRVENRKVTEAEWYLARANDPGLNGPRQPGRGPANAYNVDYLRNQPPDRVVPAAQRSTREERQANSYFDAIVARRVSHAVRAAAASRRIAARGALPLARGGGGPRRAAQLPPTRRSGSAPGRRGDWAWRTQPVDIGSTHSAGRRKRRSCSDGGLRCPGSRRRNAFSSGLSSPGSAM